MDTNLEIITSVNINSTKEKVWDALINPEIIKEYLFGTEAISDWKIGSPIIFQGEYQGHKYKDKGNILIIKNGQLFNMSIGVDFQVWKTNQKIIQL